MSGEISVSNQKTFIEDAPCDCQHGCPLNLSSHKVFIFYTSAAFMTNILLLIFYWLTMLYKYVLLDCWITFCLHRKMCASCLQQAICFKVKSELTEWHTLNLVNEFNQTVRCKEKRCLLSKRTSSSSSLAKLMTLTSCFLVRRWSKRFILLLPEQSGDSRSSLVVAELYMFK